MYYIALFVVVLSFFMGLLEVLFGIPPSYSGFSIDLLVLMLFLFVLLKGKKAHLPYFKIIILFIIFSVISALYNNTSYINLLIGLKKYVLPLLFIYVVANIKITNQQFLKFNKIIFFLFVLQIPMAFIKLYLYGFGNESSLIGTIANSGGSTSTVLPMLGSSLFIVYYLFNHKRRYLIYILGIFFFGIVGGKRAVVFYTPLSLLISYMLYRYFIEGKKKIISTILNPKIIIRWVIVAFLIIYVGVRLNPTLNPENKVGGSFDINYVINYALNYSDRHDANSTDNYRTRLNGSGRLNALSATLDFLGYKKAIGAFSFGIGPGSMESSILNPKSMLNFESLNLGYAVSIVGLTRIILQFGIIGFLLFFWFYYKIINNYVIFQLTNNTYNSNIKYFVITLSWSLLFFIDFITYSQAITSTRAFYYTFYFLVGYSIKLYYKQKRIMS